MHYFIPLLVVHSFSQWININRHPASNWMPVFSSKVQPRGGTEAKEALFFTSID